MRKIGCSVVSVALLAVSIPAQLTWTQVATSGGPGANSDHALAYDSIRGRVVLFGWNGTWEFDGASWVQVSTANSPSARSEHAMAFDSARGRVVLFGGKSGGVTLGDTWEYDGVDWLPVFAAAAPPAREEAAMVYDSARGRAVLFGGDTGPSLLDDTWEFDGLSWAQVATANSPTSRYMHGMAYDSARGVSVLFGGGFGGMSDTWEYDGANWVARSTPTVPPGRREHSMAFHAGVGRVVMFGGYQVGAGLLPAETWAYDGGNWSLTTTGGVPSARSRAAMTYGAGVGGVVLSGGMIGNSQDDTWVLAAVPSVTATATAYGSGCGSPALDLVPDPAAMPIIGTAGGATIQNAPTLLGAVAVGFDNQFFGGFQLPVTLSGLGMTGCQIWQSSEIMGLAAMPLTASTLGLTLSIPNDPSLLNGQLFLQAYCYAPGVNPLGVIVSNGIEWLVGNQ